MEAVQEDVLSVLSEVGLSEVEVSVYKAALALGSRPASVIAQKAGLKRGHTYNILESLMEKGIVQEFVKSSVRHFVCSSPHSLLSMLQKKEHELAEQKRKLERAIPHLEQIRNPVAAQPKVRFYKGLEAIKEIFEDMLAVPNSIIYGFIDLEQSWSSANEAGHYWTRNFIKRREQKNIA
ncbi:MAG TPA: helix-turn-helix domain-containing protein, partial [Oligoflexia bacterium]|nr:helix-turn-helix domain-containing protein [Oligoflexia bacterium]